jgi:recombination protein RecA
VTERLDTQERLNAALARIQQRHGTRALVRGKPPSTVGTESTVAHVSTGFPPLDQATGIGGLPKGRINEMVGPATSGKTTLALLLLAQAQRGNKHVAYVDRSRSIDPDYAHRCGLDLFRLLIVRPHNLQESMAMTEAIAGSGGVEAVVFDSPGSLWCDTDASSQLSAFLDRLASPVAHARVMLLFLRMPVVSSRQNQRPQSQDEMEVQSSSLRALAHHATIRLSVTRERWLRRHGDIRGYTARVEVLKNRMGPAGRSASISISFNGTIYGDGL